MSTIVLNKETADIERVAAAVTNFVSKPASPKPLAVLRIGLASVLLLQGLALSANLLDLYGSRGVVQWAISDGTVAPTLPRLGWVVELLGNCGLSEPTAIRGLFAVYMGGLAALLLGYRTRTAAVLVWLTHLMMNTSAVFTVYGVDTFANIFLFYCTWMPIGAAWSLDRAAGRTSDEPTSLARLSLRVLQLHLCLVYFVTGVEKSMGEDWWNGIAIWDSVMRSDLCAFDMSWMAKFPLAAMAAGWGTLVLEVGYPFFMWSKKTRKFWAASIISLHVGIAIFLGLVSFAAVMSVLTFSAFFVVKEDAETPVELEAAAV